MVVWVQPTNDTKRRVVAPLLGIAMLTTLFRLTVRVIVALSFLIILLVSMWLRTIPGQTCIYGSAKRSRITALKPIPRRPDCPLPKVDLGPPVTALAVSCCSHVGDSELRRTTQGTTLQFAVHPGIRLIRNSNDNYGKGDDLRTQTPLPRTIFSFRQMVVWVQPTSDTKRRVVAPLLGIAMLTTLFRLTVRVRTRKCWLDDAWVIVALSSSIIMLVSMWLRTIPGQSKYTFIVTYWASRMSVIFSIIRLIPHQFLLRKITTGVAAVFAVFWLGLMIQVAHVCGKDKSWYKMTKPQCRLDHGVAVLELSTDVFADLALAIIPIILIRNTMLPSSQRKMLVVIFTASLLTTLVSIVHAVFVLGPSGSLEGISAHAEAATALIVANVAVMVTSLYRLFRRSDYMDPKPYTYNYALQSGGVVKERVRRNQEESTIEFRSPPSAVSVGKGKIDGESTTAAFSVLVTTDGSHQDDVDSDRGVKTSATL
ncbi:hypothetical protein B0H14DRAFT_3123600 [Mycena olivaceomarginata]|nr:hypothetical protein B0H14DRAFT_3123600 [Mycena olivaceomarginata]